MAWLQEKKVKAETVLQRAKRVSMWLMGGKQLLEYVDRPLRGKRETGTGKKLKKSFCYSRRHLKCCWTREKWGNDRGVRCWRRHKEPVEVWLWGGVHKIFLIGFFLKYVGKPLEGGYWARTWYHPIHGLRIWFWLPCGWMGAGQDLMLIFNIHRQHWCWKCGEWTFQCIPQWWAGWENRNLNTEVQEFYSTFPKFYSTVWNWLI